MVYGREREKERNEVRSLNEDWRRFHHTRFIRLYRLRHAAAWWYRKGRTGRIGQRDELILQHDFSIFAKKFKLAGIHTQFLLG